MCSFFFHKQSNKYVDTNITQKKTNHTTLLQTTEKMWKIQKNLGRKNGQYEHISNYIIGTLRLLSKIMFLFRPFGDPALTILDVIIRPIEESTVEP